jgi:hypothetical protein
MTVKKQIKDMWRSIYTREESREIKKNIQQKARDNLKRFQDHMDCPEGTHMRLSHPEAAIMYYWHHIVQHLPKKYQSIESSRDPQVRVYQNFDGAAWLKLEKDMKRFLSNRGQLTELQRNAQNIKRYFSDSDSKTP